MDRPFRKSSEAPEVVVHGENDHRTWVTTDRLKRSGHGALHAKQLDINDFDSTKSPPTPSIPPPSPYPTTLFTVEDENRSLAPRRRTFGILETILLALVAFLIGGAIGGGVGGALLVKEKSKSSTTNGSATSSAAAPARTGNYIVDTAGCPAIETSGIWNSTTAGKGFRRVCYKDSVGASQQNIITSNVSVSSFDACLNACATTSDCVAATWYMFSVSSPLKNAKCYFKNAVGVQVAQPEGDSLATAYLV